MVNIIFENIDDSAYKYKKLHSIKIITQNIIQSYKKSQNQFNTKTKAQMKQIETIKRPKKEVEKSNTKCGINNYLYIVKIITNALKFVGEKQNTM